MSRTHSAGHSRSGLWVSYFVGTRDECEAFIAGARFAARRKTPAPSLRRLDSLDPCGCGPSRDTFSSGGKIGCTTCNQWDDPPVPA